MRARGLNIALKEGGKGPLFLRVAEAVIEAILDGRIQPGMLLPGVRDLAEQMGVHYNTVLVALREMQAQGWVEARPRSGFQVSTPLPAEAREGDAPRASALVAGFDIPAGREPITTGNHLVMDLTDGRADARLAPADALAQAYQRALRLKGPELLGATDSKGLLRLRETLSSLMGQQRGLSLDPEQLLILRSSSFAVNLVAQALIGNDGGHVAVENPGNPLVWEVFRNTSSGQIHALPVDGDGLVVEALEDLMKTVRLNLLVLSPQCHFPTGAVLSAPRRKKVLELARQYRFAILEMDPEYDHLPTDPLPRPLASEDPTGQVLYLGSLSRLFAPGLRISFLTVPGSLADRLAKVRQRMDWQGDPVLEWSIAELILDGEFLRQQRRVRKVSRERRTALLDAIHHTLARRVEVTAEHSAMAIWIRGVEAHADPHRFNAWIQSCNLKGLKLRPGKYYDFDGRDRAATRLGFSAYLPEELQRAVALMG